MTVNFAFPCILLRETSFCCKEHRTCKIGVESRDRQQTVDAMWNRKGSGLCPTETLCGVPAQVGRVVSETASYCFCSPEGVLKDDFVYLVTFCNVPNADILVTACIQLF
jgi:hypothetical protein